MIVLLLRRGLRIQRRGIRAVRKFRMGEVEPGVDDRDRLAGPWRIDSVRADRAPPPLQGHERVGRLRRDRFHGQQPVGSNEPDDAGATEVGDSRGGHAPEPELGGHLRPAGLTSEPHSVVEVRPVELYELGPRWSGRREKRDDHENQEPGRHPNGEYSRLLGSGDDARLCRPGLEPRGA